MIENKIKKLIKEYQDYAEKNGFQLNPNQEIVKKLMHGLLENEKKYGAKYCPCRRVSRNKQKDKKIICPCVYHKKEIEEQEHCHCFLFVQK